MTVALVLLVYAVLLSTIAPRLLRGAKWAGRAPRLAIAMWQALTVTVVTSVAMAGLALTVPTLLIAGDPMVFLDACAMALREQFATPGGAAIGATGATLAIATIGRGAWCLGAATVRMLRERAVHLRMLDIVGRRDDARGLMILDSEEPAVYCLPGRSRRLVVTTAALRSLSDAHLEAVLAHERAHLTERHDLVVAYSAALARAFGGIALFQSAASETARLIELRADDVAAARTDRLTVAGALLAVVSGRAVPAVPTTMPAVALGAGGSGGAARVRRLIPPRNPIGRTHAVLGSAAVVALLAIPALVIGAPVTAAAQQTLCPPASIVTAL